MFLRIILLPFGFVYRIFQIFLDGGRDLHNKLRFPQSFIDSGCCITNNSLIAPNCHLLENSLLINSTIGSFSYVSYRGIIQNATIGKYCSIANDVIIGLGKHPINYLSTSPLFYRVNNPLKYKLVKENSDFQEYHRIEIGNDVWIGARVIIMDGVKIGNGAVIGANSVVTKDVPDYAIVVGSPAKIIKFRFDEQTIKHLLNVRWWNLDFNDLNGFMNNFNEKSNEFN